MGYNYKIIKCLGIISEGEDKKGYWSKEANIVSWNGKAPMVDVRMWGANHETMSRGFTLTDEEAEMLAMILHNYAASKNDKTVYCKKCEYFRPDKRYQGVIGWCERHDRATGNDDACRQASEGSPTWM